MDLVIGKAPPWLRRGWLDLFDELATVPPFGCASSSDLRRLEQFRKQYHKTAVHCTGPETQREFTAEQ